MKPPNSPVIRALHDPYIIPFQGVLTLAHMGKEPTDTQHTRRNEGPHRFLVVDAISAPTQALPAGHQWMPSCSEPGSKSAWSTHCVVLRILLQALAMIAKLKSTQLLGRECDCCQVLCTGSGRDLERRFVRGLCKVFLGLRSQLNLGKPKHNSSALGHF